MTYYETAFVIGYRRFGLTADKVPITMDVCCF